MEVIGLEKKKTNLIGIGIIVVALLLLGILAILWKAFIPYYKYPVETTRASVPYETERKPNSDMWEFEERVSREGKSGEKEVYTYFEEKYINGELKYRKEIFPSDKPKEKIVKQPLTEIVQYGTKKGYPTGYVWEIRGEHNVNIRLTKIKLNNDIVEIHFLVKNLSEDIEITKYLQIDAPHSTAYSLYEGKVESEGPEIIKTGEEAEVITKVKEETDPWPQNYKIYFAGRGPWYGIFGYEGEISLDKFWVGTFNQQ